MLLQEFFGRTIDPRKNLQGDNDNKGDKDLKDSLFTFMLEHDKLYKDYLFPLATKIKKLHEDGSDNKEMLVREFMPMVKKGCIEYYEKKKMMGHPRKLFPKEMRKDLCEKLYDHYYEDIINDCYSLGI